jgi:hypothetical protein
MERRGRGEQLRFNSQGENETSEQMRAKKLRTWRHPKNRLPVQNERNNALKHSTTRQNAPSAAPCRAQTVPCKNPQETKKTGNYGTRT